MTEVPERGRRPQQGEPVLDRAFRLLDVFTGSRPTVGLTELAGQAGLPLSTALRLATRLVRLGALERGDDGNFAIGLRMLQYAALAPRGHGLRALALPYMEDLHRATRQHVQFAVREQDEGVMVERLSAPGAGRVLYHAGAKFPLHATSLGLVLLAYARPEFQAGNLRRGRFLEPEGTPVDASDLRARLDRIRASGSARLTRMLPEPAESVAAPVFDRSGGCIAAISVLGAGGTVSMPMVEPAVIAIAHSISRDMARTSLESDSATD